MKKQFKPIFSAAKQSQNIVDLPENVENAWENIDEQPQKEIEFSHMESKNNTVTHNSFFEDQSAQYENREERKFRDNHKEEKLERVLMPQKLIGWDLPENSKVKNSTFQAIKRELDSESEEKDKDNLVFTQKRFKLTEENNSENHKNNGFIRIRPAEEKIKKHKTRYFDE